MVRATRESRGTQVYDPALSCAESCCALPTKLTRFAVGATHVSGATLDFYRTVPRGLARAGRLRDTVESHPGGGGPWLESHSSSLDTLPAHGLIRPYSTCAALSGLFVCVAATDYYALVCCLSPVLCQCSSQPLATNSPCITPRLSQVASQEVSLTSSPRLIPLRPGLYRIA